MTPKQQFEGMLLGLRVVGRGLDFAIQSIKDVQVMIDVFIKKCEEEMANHPEKGDDE